MIQEVSWTDSKGEERKARKAWTIDWGGSSALVGSGGRQSNPNLDTAWNHGLNNHKEFTFHLFNSDSTTTPSGSNYQVFNHKLKEGNINTVVAAMNLMDNDKYSVLSYNAFCTNGGVRTHAKWGTAGGRFVRMSSCNVKFDNAAATTKMKRGEKPTDEEMFNVKSKSHNMHLFIHMLTKLGIELTDDVVFDVPVEDEGAFNLPTDESKSPSLLRERTSEAEGEQPAKTGHGHHHHFRRHLAHHGRHLHNLESV